MVVNVNKINEKIAENEERFMEASDMSFQKQLKKAADKIFLEKKEKPMVLISGPSGSGKTTTAVMLEKILEQMGVYSHTISMDDYFLSLTQNDMKLLEKDELDLESPLRLNTDLLNTQLEKIKNCEPVTLPRYDFTVSKSVKSDRVLKRKPGEVVVVEGIHSLNDSVVTTPDDESQRIYVSVRTRIASNGLVLHPEKIRLLRRMIRNKLYRNNEIQQTLHFYKSVQHGEKNYILPYKYRSNFDIDTFIPYEVGVYKTVLYKELLSINDNSETDEILTVLGNCSCVDPHAVPQNSLIREFIG